MFYFFLHLIYVSVHSLIPLTCEKYRTMLSGYNGSCPLWALVSSVLTKSKVLHLELSPSIMLIAFAHTSSVCFIVYSWKVKLPLQTEFQTVWLSLTQLQWVSFWFLHVRLLAMYTFPLQLHLLWRGFLTTWSEVVASYYHINLFYFHCSFCLWYFLICFLISLPLFYECSMRADRSLIWLVHLWPPQWYLATQLALTKYLLNEWMDSSLTTAWATADTDSSLMSLYFSRVWRLNQNLKLSLWKCGKHLADK